MKLPIQIFNSLSFALLVAVAWVSAALRDRGGETHIFSETSHKPYNAAGGDSEHSNMTVSMAATHCFAAVYIGSVGTQ